MDQDLQIAAQESGIFSNELINTLHPSVFERIGLFGRLVAAAHEIPEFRVEIDEETDKHVYMVGDVPVGTDDGKFIVMFLNIGKALGLEQDG